MCTGDTAKEFDGVKSDHCNRLQHQVNGDQAGELRTREHHHQYPYLSLHSYSDYPTYPIAYVVFLQLVTCTENIEKYNVEIYR